MSAGKLVSPNALEAYLGKSSQSFLKEDIIRFCVDNAVEMVNFHYCGWDGRLKTLSFVLQGLDHLDSILSSGERVDGSSLFPFIQAGKSDLYVLPKYRTAFLNPFAEVPTVDFLCCFFDRDGQLFESAPEQILRRADEEMKAVTGLSMETMGELEYYVISDQEPLYPVADQKGYHESAPFNKTEAFRLKAMRLIAAAGGKIKYGHSEVGNFTYEGKNYEQNEIEFLPCPIQEAADQLVIAKWIMRQLAYEWDVELTFAPKITAGKAGSGMHVHCRFTKDGKNMNVDAKGEQTDVCRKAIAGFMDAGTSLPAFGNPHPLSFMRLVPHQEAPTSLCWSFSNRSALVRVPLGWTADVDMAAGCNPLEKAQNRNFSQKSTFEWRASDGFADTYLLMAALCCAARHGFEMPNGLEVAEKTFVPLGVNIHDKDNEGVQKSLEQLPGNCYEAAGELEKDREIYTSRGVFSSAIVDHYIKYLKSFNDQTLRDQLQKDPQALLSLVQENIDRG